VIIAIALSITFVAASSLNARAHWLNDWLGPWLRRFQTHSRRPDDIPIDPGEATIMVFGMGRVGVGAYDAMRERHGDTVLGVDSDPAVVGEQNEAGRSVILGAATDADFWERAPTAGVGRIRMVMLTMPNHTENVRAVSQLVKHGYNGLVTATARFDDEIAGLEQAGAHAVFNIYAEAGLGFADHVCELLGDQNSK
jgi:voltage-gated potassium channel Kch